MNQTSTPLPPISAEDAIPQSAVLWLLIDCYPTRLTLAEIQHQLIATPPGSASERTTISESLEPLVEAKLIELDGDLAMATRAAIRASELLQ